VSKHAVETVDKVQAQKDMIGMELEKGLDPVDDGFNARSCPSPKLERSKQAGDGARRDKTEG
jgi:hypothetical protein